MKSNQDVYKFEETFVKPILYHREAVYVLFILGNRNKFYMGSHLSHKNLKRSKKIIGSPEPVNFV